MPRKTWGAVCALALALLSSTGAELGLMIASGATSMIVEVPVRRTAQVAPARQVRLVVDRSMLGQPDLVLTGTVTPAS